MTDQPNGPLDSTPGEPAAAPPPQAPPPAGPTPAAGPPPAGPPPAGPPPAGPYGTPQQPAQYGAPQQTQAYGVAPQANPYGGYTAAPAYAAAGQPGFPGSLAYVEQNFGKVANFGQRALAYLIDMAITLIGLVPMVLGIILITVGASDSLTTDDYGNITSTGEGDPTLVVVGILLIVLGGLISLGITIWNRVFKMGRTGQSVGKKVIGLYLLDDKTGLPVGAGMAFVRELVNGLVNQVFYIGWLWMLWDTDKQTLGDKAVHSNVVVVSKR